MLAGCASKNCGLAVGCKTPCDKGGCADASKWTAFGEQMKLTGGKAGPLLDILGSITAVPASEHQADATQEIRRVFRLA